MYRHSLFFRTQEEAEQAQYVVRKLSSLEITEDYFSNDGESYNIEYRFFTEGTYSTREVGYIVGSTRPETYALNCDDGD